MPHTELTPATLTGEIVAAHYAVIATLADTKRLWYMMWDGETQCELIIDECVYGFPSVVFVKHSIGSGVEAKTWTPYGRELEVDDGRTLHYAAMFAWVAEQLIADATGSLFTTDPTHFSTIQHIYQ